MRTHVVLLAALLLAPTSQAYALSSDGWSYETNNGDVAKPCVKVGPYKKHAAKFVGDHSNMNCTDNVTVTEQTGQAFDLKKQIPGVVCANLSTMDSMGFSWFKTKAACESARNKETNGNKAEEKPKVQKQNCKDSGFQSMVAQSGGWESYCSRMWESEYLKDLQEETGHCCKEKGLGPKEESK